MWTRERKHAHNHARNHARTHARTQPCTHGLPLAACRSKCAYTCPCACQHICPYACAYTSLCTRRVLPARFAGLYSHGLYTSSTYGLYNYGLHGYGINSYGPARTVRWCAWNTVAIGCCHRVMPTCACVCACVHTDLWVRASVRASICGREALRGILVMASVDAEPCEDECAAWLRLHNDCSNDCDRRRVALRAIMVLE